MQRSPGAADVKILLQHGLQVALFLEHLQHLPLQLKSELLQHLVANHERDLVAQALTGNLTQGNTRVDEEERKGKPSVEILLYDVSL